MLLSLDELDLSPLYRLRPKPYFLGKIGSGGLILSFFLRSVLGVVGRVCFLGDLYLGFGLREGVWVWMEIVSARGGVRLRRIGLVSIEILGLYSCAKGSIGSSSTLTFFTGM